MLRYFFHFVINAFWCSGMYSLIGSFAFWLHLVGWLWTKLRLFAGTFFSSLRVEVLELAHCDGNSIGDLLTYIRNKHIFYFYWLWLHTYIVGYLILICLFWYAYFELGYPGFLILFCIRLRLRFSLFILFVVEHINTFKYTIE